MVVAVKPFTVKVGPVNTTLVSEASLYQVNTGWVTVVLEAINITVVPEQIRALLTAISAAVANSLTVTVTTLALAGKFSHLLSPLTVT
ncbi:hypothetical protein D3C86_737910 [compost metagenome]